MNRHVAQHTPAYDARRRFAIYAAVAASAVGGALLCAVTGIALMRHLRWGCTPVSGGDVPAGQTVWQCPDGTGLAIPALAWACAGGGMVLVAAAMLFRHRIDASSRVRVARRLLWCGAGLCAPFWALAIAGIVAAKPLTSFMWLAAGAVTAIPALVARLWPRGAFATAVIASCVPTGALVAAAWIPLLSPLAIAVLSLWVSAAILLSASVRRGLP